MPPARDAQGRFISGSARPTLATSGTFAGQVVFYPEKLAELLRGPNGPVTRMMLRVTNAVKREAVATAPVYRLPPEGPARARTPGTLRDSIVSRIVDEGGQPVGYVGTDDPVGRYVHEGTDPHVILPRNGPYLVFWSAAAGRVVYAKRVMHPGTKPNRWLTEALATVVNNRRY